MPSNTDRERLEALFAEKLRLQASHSAWNEKHVAAHDKCRAASTRCTELKAVFEEAARNLAAAKKAAEAADNECLLAGGEVEDFRTRIEAVDSQIDVEIARRAAVCQVPAAPAEIDVNGVKVRAGQVWKFRETPKKKPKQHDGHKVDRLLDDGYVETTRLKAGQPYGSTEPTRMKAESLVRHYDLITDPTVTATVETVEAPSDDLPRDTDVRDLIAAKLRRFESKSKDITTETIDPTLMHTRSPDGWMLYAVGFDRIDGHKIVVKDENDGLLSRSQSRNHGLDTMRIETPGDRHHKRPPFWIRSDSVKEMFVTPVRVRGTEVRCIKLAKNTGQGDVPFKWFIVDVARGLREVDKTEWERTAAQSFDEAAEED